MYSFSFSCFFFSASFFASLSFFFFSFVCLLFFPIEPLPSPFQVRSRGGGGKKAVKTLGGQFKASLTSLMDTLNATSPSFVRTIKPNKLKVQHVGREWSARVGQGWVM
jgi:hypothetical protein